MFIDKVNDWSGKREDKVGLKSETLEEEELWRIGREKGGEEEIVVVDMVIVAICYNNAKTKTHTDGDWLMNHPSSSTYASERNQNPSDAKDDILSIP